MSSKRETCRALLLRSVDYGESDRIVTLLTSNKGKISALARGARKSWRRFGGALELFSIFEVTLASPRGRGRLWRLEEAHLEDAYSGLATDLMRIGAASFIIEIVREAVPELEPQPEVFALVEKALPLIAENTGAALAALTVATQLRVLALAGMGVSVDHCNACGRQVPRGKPVKFHPARGGVVCTPCGGGPILLSASTAEILIDLCRSDLSQAVKTRFDKDTAAEVEGALAGFVEHHLERPLSTRSLFSLIDVAN